MKAEKKVLNTAHMNNLVMNRILFYFKYYVFVISSVLMFHYHNRHVSITITSLIAQRNPSDDWSVMQEIIEL
jgi:hypothetical protein